MPVRVYIGCYTEKLGFVDGAGSGITTADVDMATGAVTVAPGIAVTQAGVSLSFLSWTLQIAITYFMWCSAERQPQPIRAHGSLHCRGSYRCTASWTVHKYCNLTPDR